jgi:uncharacterized cofD-like protein
MKKIVTIGGGTGTFVVLSGLRMLPDVSLSAIVTEADDGGSTGRLRDAYGFLPPGDARQALVALAEEGDVLRDLFAYRFSKGEVAGHNLGNLFLTALTDLLGSDVKALEEASKILRVKGRVIPATEAPATLVATLENGSIVEGESAIGTKRDNDLRIQSITLKDALPMTESAKTALSEADVIILGPGCLFTSTIAALLPEGMKEVIAASPAKLVYITNLFTKAGQTDGYTLSDHVREITRYAGRKPDAILVDNSKFSQEVLDWYKKENEFPAADDLPTRDLAIYRRPIASVHVVPPVPNDPLRRSLMRHDSDKLREALAPIIA